MINSNDMSADINRANIDKKGVLDLLSLRNRSLKGRTRLSFMVLAVAALVFIVLFTHFTQRKMTVNEVNNHLTLLTDTKSKQLEDHFAHLNERIKNFSNSRQTIDAFSQLSAAFQTIESDDYLPSSVRDAGRMNALIEGYYKTEVLPLLGPDTEKNAGKLKNLLPEDNKQRILQFLYITSNPKPFGLKGTTLKADDGSAYTYMHALYHPEIVLFARQAGVSDVIFADYKTGYVIYSLKKNLDFATSLFYGPYRNSAMGLAFKRAISQQVSGNISYTDVTIYGAALNKPQLFISAPVYNGSELLGAVIVALDNTTLNNLMLFDKEGTNRITTLKSLIIGDDFAYRCDDPEYLTNPEKYTRRLRRNASHAEAALKAREYGTVSMVQHVDGQKFSVLMKRLPGSMKYTSETGSTVLCSYKPLRIGDLNWTILTQVNRSEAMNTVTRFTVFLILIATVIILILWHLSGLINLSVTSRLESIRNNLEALSRGEFKGEIPVKSGDEIGTIGRDLNQLGSRMEASATFISELSRGNLDVDFPVLGDNDSYGLSMNQIKQSLMVRRAEEEKRKKEDDIRNWTNQGIAMFNDIMRTDNNNLEKLTFNIIRNLVQYLSANQGGLFLMEEEDERQYLNLVAAYAYDRQKFLQKRIEIGEGMAGTCVLEKKTILTNKLPDNYMAITSGLGGAKPRCLLVVPLKKDDEVLGVLEIASFEDFKPYEVELVEKIAENMASALITVKLHLQTTQYLERFQQQAEEMKAQDEELRQNIEELQATHEQMERLKAEEDERNRKIMKELDDYRKLLISLINEVPEKIFLKDDQGRFVIANKPVAENYGKTVDEILGKSDFDFYPHDQAAEYFRHEQEIIRSGKEEVYEEGDPSKEDGLIVRTIKKPFYIEHLGVTGLFGVQFDITDIKRREFEFKKMAEDLAETSGELQAQEEVLRQNIEELQAANEEMERMKQEDKERTEKQIKEMEDYRKFLIDVLDQIPGKIFVKDHEGRLLLLNSEVARVYNKTVDELLGTTDFDNHPHEQAKEYWAKEQQIIANGSETYIQEEELTGSKRYLKTTKSPIYLHHLKTTGVLGIQIDVTDFLNVQEESRTKGEELMQEKALLDALLENVPECIYFKDSDSRFIRFSNSMLKLFGLTKKEELLGKTDFDFFAEEHARPAFEDEQKIIKTGKALIDIEEKEVMPDGRYNWVNTSKMPLRDKNGNIIGTFGISKNITKIKNMEFEAVQMTETMEKNHKLLIDILNNIPAKIFLKDENGAFVVVNEAVASIYNKTPEQIIGTTDFDNHPDEDVASWRKQELEIIKNGPTTYLHIEKQNGRERYLNTTKTPFVLATTGKTGLLGIQIDVSELKIAEQEIKRLREENRRLKK